MLPRFQFDEQKSFSDNINDFVSHLRSIDNEMADILEANLESLSKIVVNGERDSQLRGEMNASILQSLDFLADNIDDQGGS